MTRIHETQVRETQVRETQVRGTRIRLERPSDAAAREALLDAAYGPARFEKPSQRLRAGRAPARGLSLVATAGGAIVGTVRLWEASAGADRPALLLGPLAVHPEHRGIGIGAALMRHALDYAARRGHRTVLLVGDAAYYGRFGFTAEHTGALWLPGLDDRSRLLGCELVPDALDGARGTIRAPRKPQRTRLLDAVAALAAPASPKAA
ncbi:MAG: N-acetyltransferase [Alphaproteobacteria bacterium]|nr:N-acetyltransferase [Alphaproteobacteria bacterium]